MELKNLDLFTQGYITCALWTWDDDAPSGDYEACGRASELFRLIYPDDLRQAIEDCEKFQADNAEIIASNLSRAGNDFWLTRNRHGAGFWDGDWKEHGDKLTEASHAFGEIDVSRDGDVIYIE